MGSVEQLGPHLRVGSSFRRGRGLAEDPGGQERQRARGVEG